MVCKLEWCDSDIKSIKGEKIPNSIAKYFIKENVFLLTPKTALEMIPSKLKSVLKPEISSLFKVQNIEYATMSPYFENKKLKGFFSLDVCKNNKQKPIITDELKKIIYEMGNIVSSDWR